MSANYVVDLLGTTYANWSLTSTAIAPASGAIVGVGVDMLTADTYTNLLLTGRNVHTSGQIQIQVQTSDTDVSGNYTDPTSGLSQFPTVFQSGSNVFLNSGTIGGGSGLYGGIGLGPGTSGGFMWSGYTVFAAFQRPHRFVRVVIPQTDPNSNPNLYLGSFQAAFIGQLRTTASGGGYTPYPSSGTVNV